MALTHAAIPRIFPTPQVNELKDSYTTIKSAKKVNKILNQKQGNPAIWKALPRKEGAYAIEITPGALNIYAYDGTGLFYARQTLVQLLSEQRGESYLYAQNDPTEGKTIYDLVVNAKLPLGTLVDWPDLPYRGSVEGYYGAPWSHKARISQLEFYGRNKLNTYIWAAKDDPYHHGARSYDPYPASTAAEIRELCEVAKKNHVKFVWAIHPANTVNWNKEGGNYDLARLVVKLEQMYDLGVRDFGVFIDDSNGEINKAERQVALCNYIQKNFIAKKKDVGPIIMCPTGYNKSWSNADYLKKLGTGLTPDQHIMWTGNTVCHDITLEGQEWVKNTLGRPTFIWWNWPVHDYCTAHLPMGRTYGLSQDPKMLDLMTGFVSNPMALPEASKTALFGVGDYTWNIIDFDSMENWKQGMRRLYPVSHAAMQTFANHSSDLGNNFHGYRREESVDITPTVKRLQDSIKEGKIDKDALSTLEKEFAKLKAAAQTLEKASDTKLVVPEIKPWLQLAIELGDMGHAAAKALAQPTMKNFAPIQDLWEKWNEGAPNRTQHAPRVVGWTVLRPLIMDMVADTQSKIYTQLSGRKPSLSNHPTFTASSGNPAANAEKLFDRSDSSFWESAKAQTVGDWYALDFGAPTPIKSVHLNMGGSRANDFIAKGQLEYSQDGKTWKPLGKPQQGAQVQFVLPEKKVLNARHLRYRVLENKNNWLAITTFDINRSAAPSAKSTVAGWENLNVARQEDKFYGIGKNFEVKTMKPGESVSMSFPNPVAATWLEVNFDNAQLGSWADITLTLEDGSSMKPRFNMAGSVLSAKGNQLPSKRITAMTLTNKGKTAQEVKMSMFKLDCPPIDTRDMKESMTDKDLLSYYDASRGLNETISIPAGTKRVHIICKNVGIHRATPVPLGMGKRVVPHHSIFDVDDPKATSIKLQSDPRKDARIYEIIFSK